MKFRRFMALLLVIVMGLCLAGCGSGKKDALAPDATEGAPETEDAGETGKPAAGEDTEAAGEPGDEGSTEDVLEPAAGEDTEAGGEPAGGEDAENASEPEAGEDAEAGGEPAEEGSAEDTPEPAEGDEAETVSAAAGEEPQPEPEQFRVGMECAYAPNNWQESEPTDTNVPIENVPGSYAEGNDVQIARIIADALNRELVVVKLGWDGLIEALNQGQIDAIIAGMMDTPARKEAINFSEPYYETVYAVMVRKDSPFADATALEDFAGASMLGQRDTSLDTVIDQIEGADHLPPADSVPDMISRLKQGTCDAIVINLENAEGFLAANPEFKVISFPEGEGFVLPSKGACVGLRKEDTELLDQVNEVLAGLDKETREEIYATAVANQPK